MRPEQATYASTTLIDVYRILNAPIDQVNSLEQRLGTAIEMIASIMQLLPAQSRVMANSIHPTMKIIRNTLNGALEGLQDSELSVPQVKGFIVDAAMRIVGIIKELTESAAKDTRIAHTFISDTLKANQDKKPAPTIVDVHKQTPRPVVIPRLPASAAKTIEVPKVIHDFRDLKPVLDKMLNQQRNERANRELLHRQRQEKEKQEEERLLESLKNMGNPKAKPAPAPTLRDVSPSDRQATHFHVEVEDMLAQYKHIVDRLPLQIAQHSFKVTRLPLMVTFDTGVSGSAFTRAGIKYKVFYDPKLDHAGGKEAAKATTYILENQIVLMLPRDEALDRASFEELLNRAFLAIQHRLHLQLVDATSESGSFSYRGTPKVSFVWLLTQHQRSVLPHFRLQNVGLPVSSPSKAKPAGELGEDTAKLAQWRKEFEKAVAPALEKYKKALDVLDTKLADEKTAQAELIGLIQPLLAAKGEIDSGERVGSDKEYRGITKALIPLHEDLAVVKSNIKVYQQKATEIRRKRDAYFESMRNEHYKEWLLSH